MYFREHLLLQSNTDTRKSRNPDNILHNPLILTRSILLVFIMRVTLRTCARWTQRARLETSPNANAQSQPLGRSAQALHKHCSRLIRAASRLRIHY